MTATAASRSPALPFTTSLRNAALSYRPFLVAAVVLLYTAAFHPEARIGSDSILYRALAESLAAGEGYRFQGAAHGLAMPGLPYCLAALFRLFPGYEMLAAHLFLVACALGALACTYRFVRLNSDAATATIVTALLAICELFFRYGFQLLTDMPFLLGLTMVLAGYEGIRARRAPRSRWADWALLGVGLVVVTWMRPQMVIVHAAIGLTATWRLLRGPQRLAHGLILVVSLASLASLWAFDPRQDEPVVDVPQVYTEADEAQPMSYEDKATRRVFEGPLRTVRQAVTLWLPELTLEGRFAEAVLQIELGLAPLNALFAVWVVVACVMVGRRRLFWGLLLLGFAAHLLAFKPIPRYMLPILPLMLYGLWLTIVVAEHRLGPRSRALWVIAMALLVVPNLVIVTRFVLEQNTLPLLEHYSDGEYVPVLAMAENLDDAVAPEDVVIGEYARALTYLSDRVVVEPTQLVRYRERDLRAWFAGQRAVYVVLPGSLEKSSRNMRKLVRRLRASIEPPLRRYEGPQGSLTLHRLQPATAAGGEPGETQGEAVPEEGADSSDRGDEPAAATD